MNPLRRYFGTFVSVVMLTAVTASFAAPSVVSAISALDGNQATSTAGGTHLPLDMAAAPDQGAEAVDWTQALDGSARTLPSVSRTSDFRPPSWRVFAAVGGADVSGECDQARLCVYRL